MNLRLSDTIKDYTSLYVAGDGGAQRIKKSGTAILTRSVMGKVTRVQLSNVQYPGHLYRNIVSYGLLGAKGGI